MALRHGWYANAVAAFSCAVQEVLSFSFCPSTFLFAFATPDYDTIEPFYGSAMRLQWGANSSLRWVSFARPPPEHACQALRAPPAFCQLGWWVGLLCDFNGTDVAPYELLFIMGCLWWAASRRTFWSGLLCWGAWFRQWCGCWFCYSWVSILGYDHWRRLVVVADSQRLQLRGI